jgi:hypothetical protein
MTPDGGVFPLGQSTGQPACFDEKEQADTAAREFGWIAEGGNHRCKRCAAEREPIGAPQGAYLRLAEVEAVRA